MLTVAIEAYTKTLALVSHLLEYPDAAWWDELPAYKAAVEEVESPQAREILAEFIGYVEGEGAKAYEEQYVRSFDFSMNTNLYLTTQERTDYGKQSEEMHRYKVLFLQNGCDVNRQLPDYLPALLELAASLGADGARHVLSAIKPRVELLRKRFIEAKLAQSFLMDVVLTETAGLEVAS